MHNPLVSVIIPVKDAAHLLGRCIEALRRQSYRAIELIVVDNGSTDGTPALAAQHGVRLLRQPAGRTPAARNAGAAAALGAYLLHIDADMELHADSVAQCVAAARAGASLVILPERNIARGYWMRAFSFGKELVRGAPGFEYGRFVERERFAAVGGYDEALHSGEDRDLHLRIIGAGAQVASIKALTLHHVEHLTIGDIVRKTAYYTGTRPAFVRKHARAASGDRAGLLRLVLSRWRLLAASPLRAAGWLGLTGFFVLRDARILRQLGRRARALPAEGVRP
jgi:glycosyltransferase involved in cell wall biosynthesis